MFVHASSCSLTSAPLSLADAMTSAGLLVIQRLIGSFSMQMRHSNILQFSSELHVPRLRSMALSHSPPRASKFGIYVYAPKKLSIALSYLLTEATPINSFENSVCFFRWENFMPPYHQICRSSALKKALSARKDVARPQVDFYAPTLSSAALICRAPQIGMSKCAGIIPCHIAQSLLHPYYHGVSEH